MEHYVSKEKTWITYGLMMITAIVAISSFASGCKNCAVVWSGATQSPDKHYIASAETVQCGGPGTASVDTVVYLKQGGQSPINILGLSNRSAYPLGITAVDMTWITPSHLHITYKGHADIFFQAVKYAGVDISVEKKEN